MNYKKITCQKIYLNNQTDKLPTSFRGQFLKKFYPTQLANEKTNKIGLPADIFL